MSSPDETPSYEDILRDMGEEKMTFLSEMLQPDPPKKEDEEK